MRSEIIKHLNSWLPHRKITLPIRGGEGCKLSVYLDNEPSIPLGMTEKSVRSFFKSIGKGYDCYLDVGGYIGAYPVLFNSLTEGTAYVVEPHPDNQERIRENIQINDMCDDIHLIEAAADAKNGETSLYLSNRSDSKHSFSVDHAGSSERITVPTITIDKVCERYSISPDFVKIDVEGAGESVINGAENLLGKRETDWLIELHGKEEGEPIINKFKYFDYSLRKLDEHYRELDEGGHTLAFANSKV